MAEGDRLVRRRDPWRLDPTFMLGRGLRGLRLGVVGMGRIGREVARLAEAHGMEVVPVGRGELDRLAEVDVVTLHVRCGRRRGISSTQPCSRASDPGRCS